MMRLILVLIGIQSTVSCFGQSYQEEDLHEFWRVEKSVLKNLNDRELYFGGIDWPVNFLYFAENHDLTAAGYAISRFNNYAIHNVSSKWRLDSKQKQLILSNSETSETLNLLQIASLKPGKKMVLIHPITFHDNSGTDEPDEVKEIKVTYRKCTAEEALNITRIGDFMIHNREVTKLEWLAYLNGRKSEAEASENEKDSSFYHPANRFKPITGITYQEALRYCDWKSQQIKELYNLDVIVRLPTQKEWTKAEKSITKRKNSNMKDEFGKPDWDIFYAVKVIKLSDYVIEWCQDGKMVYDNGKITTKPHILQQIGFRYIVEFK